MTRQEPGKTGPGPVAPGRASTVAPAPFALLPTQGGAAPQEDLQDRYQLLVDLMPDGVVVHQGGAIVYANASSARLVMAPSPEALIGRPILDFIHADSRPQLLERIAGLTVPGVPSDPTRVDLLRSDGGVSVIESVSVLTAWKGRPAMQAIMRDLTDQLAAESALRYQAALVAQVSDAIIATDGGGLVTSWNPAAAKIFGRESDDVIGRAIEDLLGPALRPARVLAADGRIETEIRLQEDVTLCVRASAARLSDDGYVLLVSDETAQREAEERFATVFRSLDTGLILIDELGVIRSANPAACMLLQERETSLVGRAMSTFLFCDDDGQPAEVPFTQVFIPDTVIVQLPQTYGFDRHDGSRVWFSINARPLMVNGVMGTAVVSMHDVSERRRAVQELHRAAYHDSLTGLPNRTYVLAKLLSALQGAELTGRHTAVLFIDLDNFKLINDSLGHEMGDSTLRTVAQRLRSMLRQSDVVARLGGDEFVVVASIQHPDEVDILARRLLAGIAAPLTGRLSGLTIRASIGIVTAAPGDARSPADLIRDADAAMYAAKGRGHNKVVMFDTALHQRLVRRIRLEADLRKALQSEALWVAYQPIVHIGSGRWRKAEALVRWTHPEIGPINPLEFIGIAEQSDLILEVGRFVLDAACRDLHTLRAGGHDDLVVSVNLSLRQVDDPGVLELIESTLARHGLAPDALCLEVTESTIAADEGNAAQILEQIRQLGVKLSIDDFGTGYSSLARLLKHRVNELKIDRSFIRDLPSDPTNRLVVAGIISLAHALGLDVVAEGVETEAHLAALTELGCDYAQGYLYAKPRPVAEYTIPTVTASG